MFPTPFIIPLSKQLAPPSCPRACSRLKTVLNAYVLNTGADAASSFLVPRPPPTPAGLPSYVIVVAGVTFDLYYTLRPTISKTTPNPAQYSAYPAPGHRLSQVSSHYSSISIEVNSAPISFAPFPVRGYPCKPCVSNPVTLVQQTLKADQH